MDVITLTHDNFDQIVAEHELLAIDFWAQWCVPCKSFSTVFSAAAKQYNDIVFCSVDIEAEQQLAADFQIRSVPFLVIIRQSIAVFAQSGALTGTALDDLLKQARTLDMQQVHQQIAQGQSE